MSIQENKAMKLKDGKILYDDLRTRINTEDEEVEGLRQSKADIIEASSTGAVASFSDGADGLNVSDLTVAIEPMQDLNGYDNPWPEGGGKNLAPQINYNTSNFTMDANYTFTQNNTTSASWAYTYSKAVIRATLPAGSYVASVFAETSSTISSAALQINDSSDNVICAVVVSTATSKTVTFTLTEETAIGLIVKIYDGAWKLQIESGSTASTVWYPPSNICPITGHTGVTVYYSGADTEDFDTLTVDWTSEAGTVYGGNIDLTTGVLTVDRAIITLDGSETWAINSDGTYIKRFVTTLSDSVTVESNADTEVNCVCSNLLGVSAYTAVNTTDASGSDAYMAAIITNHRLYILVPISVCSTVAEFKTWLASNNITVAYKLATGTEYTLTAQQITTLLGTNNIWATTGDTTVTYKANTKAYVDGHEGVTDVHINGSSVVTNGVADIPLMSKTVAGVSKAGNGFYIADSKPDVLNVDLASLSQIKAGSGNSSIRASQIGSIAFYGLAKAAGDTTQSQSDNAVGAYTDEAKSAIQSMLGTDTVIAPKETDLGYASQAYAIGDVFMCSGKLCVATAAIAANDVITIGTNCEETSVAAKFVKNTDYATSSTPGIVKINNGLGTGIANDGGLAVVRAYDSNIQFGQEQYRPIVPYTQHKSVYFGLSKLAGVDLANETVTIGTYPETSKEAIRSMLGVPASDDLNNYATKANTVLTSTLSRGRKDGTAVGEGSFAFGENVEATGYSSVALNGGIASGYASVAIGFGKASGEVSFAEGNATEANGDLSHAEGYNSKANGFASHAEGVGTIANGIATHVQGVGNVEDSVYDEWVSQKQYEIGDLVTYQETGFRCTTANSDSEFNINNWEVLGFNGDTAFAIGNGLSSNSRSNALKVDWKGNQYLGGDLYVNCNNDSTGGYLVPKDVTIDNVSIVNNGIADIPYATPTTPGVFKRGFGLYMTDGSLGVNTSTDENIKSGNTGTFTTVLKQHQATFYGLAKAAGDTTQSASDNAVGAYTDEAKAAIRAMLGAIGSEDYATSSQPGIVKTANWAGVKLENDGTINIRPASLEFIKVGTNVNYPIACHNLDAVAFYGLAKAAGDTTQSASSNAVGTYTDDAKQAIQEMLGIENRTISVSGTDPVITAEADTSYVCGEIYSLTLTPPAEGCVDVIFTCGSTLTVLNLPNTVKMPEWFVIETGHTYEINIMNGIYGTVMSWAD